MHNKNHGWKTHSFGIMIHVLIKTADENIDNESFNP